METTRKRGALIASGCAVVVLAGGVVIGTRGGDTVDAATAKKVGTDTVRRRTLSEYQTFDGSLGYADSITVTSRAQGTFTAVPKEGARLGRGTVMYRIDRKPVVLMLGDLPAYRDMSQGVSGPDVKQLKQNLRARGYDPDRDMDLGSEYFDWATEDAVQRWQDDLGVSETGRIRLGEVVFAPSGLRVAKVTAQEGGSARPGSPVFTGSSSEREVTFDLDVRLGKLAKVGAKVKVTLPDDSTTDGVISEVGRVASKSSPTAESATIEVAVAVDDPKSADALDQAPVVVDVPQTTKAGALSVPVNALLALASGGYGLEVDQGGERSIVKVEVGTFADGFVEVSGAGIADGTKVVVAQ